MSPNTLRTSASSLLADLDEGWTEKHEDREFLSSLGSQEVYVGKSEAIVEWIVALTKREWDSDFFGVEVASLRVLGRHDSANETLLSKCAKMAVSEARLRHVDCIVSRIDLALAPAMRSLIVCGFRPYDCGVHLTKAVSGESEGREERRNTSDATEQDLWDLVSLSSQTYSHDHFHQDSQIGTDAADSMYGIWIANLYRNRNCRIKVYRNESGIVGFVTVRRTNDDQASYLIDLIGVNKTAKRSGIGHALIGAIIDYLQVGDSIQVATQLSNTDALRFYIKEGFLPVSFYATLHLWLTNRRPS